MKDRDPLTVLAVVFVVVLLAVVVGALLRMPQGGPMRTVYVNVGK